MILLSEPLPLRTTAEWPGSRDVGVVLPRRYGSQCRGPLLQMTQDRLTWFWNDGASGPVTEVRTGGLPMPAGSWSDANGLDPAGKPCRSVTLAQPLPEGADIAATGGGSLDAATGAVIENPADVLFDILNGIAGRIEFTKQRLSGFRAECSRNALLSAGSIESADSPQTVARAVCGSVGARFAPGSRGGAFLFPSAAAGVARAILSQGNTAALARTANWTDVITDLTIAYAYENGSPTATIQLTAPRALRQYARRAQRLECPWISNQAVAIAVGTRILQTSARKQWVTTVSGVEANLRSGDFVSIKHALYAPADPLQILIRAQDFGTGKATLTLRAPIGPAPGIVLGTQSSQFAPNQYMSASIQLVGDQWQISIFKADNSPSANAAVLLVEAQITHYTNGAGIVTFSTTEMPSGHTYTLIATSADGTSSTQFTMTV